MRQTVPATVTGGSGQVQVLGIMMVLRNTTKGVDDETILI